MSAAAVSPMVVTGYQPLLVCRACREHVGALVKWPPNAPTDESWMVCLTCSTSLTQVCEAAYEDVIRVELSPADVAALDLVITEESPCYLCRKTLGPLMDGERKRWYISADGRSATHYDCARGASRD